MHISPNNKRYIGITKSNPIYRWNNGNGYKKNSYFNNAIIKHGWKNFEHIILFENLTLKQAETKECELITKFNSNNGKFGYNLEKGGNIQKKIGKITRKKMSKAAIKRMSDIKIRKKISNKLKGKKLTPKHIQNIIKAKTGTKLTKKHKQKLKNRIISEATRKKMSKSKMGHPVSEKTKQKISKKNKGRKFTEEHKKKISEALKGKKKCT